MEVTRNRVVGTFVARGVLGLIFLMQGYGKVFRWGVARIYQNGFAPYEATFLPAVLLKVTAYYTSYVELTAGFLVLIGLWRNYALYALGSVLLIVSYGHGLKEPIWDLHHVFFRAALLIFLLLIPEAWDSWSVDGWRHRRRST